jgi:hypothetical protein
LLQNLGVLYPVFPTVVILLRSIIGDIEPATRESIFEAIRDLFQNRSHIVMVPANLAFAVRLVTYDRNEATDSLLIQIYNRPRIDMMVKRDILLAMAYRRGSYWLSPTIRQFAVVTPWEKRALLASSYILGDEGRHWRDSIRTQLSEVERAFLAWVGEKNNGRIWDIPL